MHSPCFFKSQERIIAVFGLSADERTVKARKNIFLMAFIKGASILANLMLVPLTLNYVDEDTYGIWLTLSSMVAWMSFLDVGLNQGLRNKLAESLAIGDNRLGKKYVSTTYALLTLIFIPLMLLLLVVAPAVDWNRLLNLNPDLSLIPAVCIVITYFCINFILSTINVVILADQKPADASLRSLIQQLASILIIFVLTKTTSGDLVKLCIGLCVAPIIVVSIFNFTLFKGRYKDIAPSLKDVDFSCTPVLMKLGVQFFIIQIAGIIQFQLTNFLIIKYFGPGDVTQYNLAYKYFGILTMVWGILTAPIWSAVTDAIAKSDVSWVKRTLKTYLKLLLLMLAAAPLMLLLANPAYHILSNGKVLVPFAISFWVMAYNIVFMFSTLFVDILNGAGKLKVQTIASCISPFVFLGVTFVLIKAGCGVPSILIASIAANFNGFLLAPIQCVKLLRTEDSIDESSLDC